MLEMILVSLTLIVPILIGIAYLTLFERKVISGIQRRKGPNIVGYGGILQPIADGIKLVLKETIIPSTANSLLFIYAPIITLFISLVGWAVIPLQEWTIIADLNIGILYLFAASSLGVYGIIIGGWASNSKYSFLGALRSAAQMVSYEVSIGLILMNVLIFVGSLSLIEIVKNQIHVWFLVPLFPISIMFFVSALAETNRPPFDLPEAEAELVAGYNVEYSAMGFALFFLGEYVNIILMSIVFVLIFMGGWVHGGTVVVCIKLIMVLYLFIWVRAALPRYRFDQLMRLGWKIFLPVALVCVLVVGGLGISL